MKFIFKAYFLIYSLLIYNLHAQSEIEQIKCSNKTVNAFVKVNLSSELVDYIMSGSTIHFKYQLKIENNITEIPIKISYDYVSRYFYLESMGKIMYYRDLYNLLSSLGKFTTQVEDTKNLSFRLKFDKDKIPAALRLTVLKNKNWDISSKWQNCN